MSDEEILKPDADHQLGERPLFDISGMSGPDARDYILSIATHLKQTEKELAALEEEIKLWEGRVQLATQKSMPDLQTQAQLRLDELKSKKVQRELEVWEFRDGVEKLKKQLKFLPTTERTVNPEALLENLERLAGPTDRVTPELKRTEADDALAALKRKLAGEAPPKEEA